MSATAPPLPERFSATFLGRAEQCLRAAQLDKEADTGEGPATVGRVFHEVASTAGLTAKAWGRETLTAAELDGIARNVLRNPEEQVDALSLTEWRRVLELTRLFADAHRFHADDEYETLSHQVLDGQILSARLDRVCVRGTVCEIEDWKTGGGLPSRGEPPITTTLEIYAWHKLQAMPWLEEFEVTRTFVAYGVRRSGTMMADELTGPGSIEEWLSDQIARIRGAYATGQPLKARRGSWCHTCPDRAGCPLPKWAQAAPIRSEVDARKALDTIIGDRAEVKDLLPALRAWIDGEGLTHIVSGDMEIGYELGGDRDSTRFAVRKARNGGES